MTNLTETIIQEFFDKCGNWFKDFHPNNIKLMRSFLSDALEKQDKETAEEKEDLFSEIRGLLREHAQCPDLWDTDARLQEWLKEKGEL